MPKIDLDSVPQTNKTGYPAPFDKEVTGRWYRRLAPASGITDFGVSHVVLKPGAWSSQRHLHYGEDEFMVMLAGAAVLIDEDGRTPLGPGDCVAFPKNDGNAHHIVNESEADATFVVVGVAASREGGTYADIDMQFTADGRYLRKDGTEYDKKRI